MRRCTGHSYHNHRRRRPNHLNDHLNTFLATMGFFISCYLSSSIALVPLYNYQYEKRICKPLRSRRNNSPCFEPLVVRSVPRCLVYQRFQNRNHHTVIKALGDEEFDFDSMTLTTESESCEDISKNHENIQLKYIGTDKSGSNGSGLDAEDYIGEFIAKAMLEEQNKDKLLDESIPKAVLKSSNVLESSEDIAVRSSIMDEMKRMMQQQQQQIDLLMKLVQGGQHSSKFGPRLEKHPSNFLQTEPKSGVNIAPLRAMLFIDGTWLYYSLHARASNRCPIVAKLGQGWQSNYKVDWMALPRLISTHIEKQRISQTSFNGSDRPLEISRVLVFTSAKKETDPNSIRMRMFREMSNANYDVHMMETVGQGEKCVDIQLAVEMLHYATVPNAYDVAILLSGDKDFVPALVRTRQKGKQVIICSMRAGCNRVLYESPHIRDYCIVWLEECLTELIIPIPEGERRLSDRASYASVFTMMRIIRDYVEAVPGDIEWVSSRDIGKYLKSIDIADSNMLEELKQSHGGLRTFLMERACNLFDVQFPSTRPVFEKTDHSFGVRIKENSDEILIDEFKKTQFFTKEEKVFLEEYKKHKFVKNDSYGHTAQTAMTDEEDTESEGESQSSLFDENQYPGFDYSELLVADLKDLCREKNLPISGKKDVLIRRLQGHDNLNQSESEGTSKNIARRKILRRVTDSPSSSFGSTSNMYASALPHIDVTRKRSSRTERVDNAITAHLDALIKEYLKASGGVAGSRDIGRYLTANCESGRGNRSALTELKEAFGSLRSFVNARKETFIILNDTSRSDSNGTFHVKLNNM